jgi:hypothetical protein
MDLILADIRWLYGETNNERKDKTKPRLKFRSFLLFVVAFRAQISG